MIQTDEPVSKRARIRELLLEAIKEHEDTDMLPTTGHYLFYELEQRGLATKQGTSGKRNRGWPPGKQDLTDELTKMREEGVISWDWIADTERVLKQWEHAPNVVEYLTAALNQFALNPWTPHEPPLILTESKSNAYVLEKVAMNYVCPIAGLRGHGGAGFLRTKVAPILRNGRIVLYLGDHDRCGHQIEANVRRVLESKVGDKIPWARIGLTETQVRFHKIDSIWKVDRRYGDKTPRECWECEALGQAGVVALVESTLKELLAQMCRRRTLRRVHDREKREVRAARRKLQNW